MDIRIVDVDNNGVVGNNSNGNSEETKVVSVFGTAEWAGETENCYMDCDNACIYCYSKADIARFKKKNVNIKGIPVAKDWDKFTKEFKSKCRRLKGAGNIMFPSTHDITPLTIEYYIKCLKYMLTHENNCIRFLIVSKPRFECIKRLCVEFEPYKDRILFRFTIGSANDEVLKFWEPKSSCFNERIACLKYAFENGFQTSISCEPRLDGDTDAVIKAVYPYVTDAIWLGSANQLKARLKLNGFADETHLLEAGKLLALCTDEYVKGLYEKWGTDPKIKWKETLKKILGLEVSKVKGSDK